MAKTKKALICGAGGFIGVHLVRQLKKEGYFVRGVDIKKPDFSKTEADEFFLLDLTKRESCQKALKTTGWFDEVYQLAADRGGAGYMEPKAAEMMHDNVLINVHMIDEAVKAKVKKYFFSSSVCVYKDMKTGAKAITEADVYPAFPENDYGWEKLYSERLLQAYNRKHGLDIRIARFQTTYGPEGTWEGLKPKAADDFARKTSMAPDGGHLEVWGDGKTVRSFTFIEDLISGIRSLMQSDIIDPTTLGSDQYVEVNDLAHAFIKASGKNLTIKYIDGPTGKEIDKKHLKKKFYVGVEARNFNLARAYSTGWKWKYTIEEGARIHYAWVKDQVEKKYDKKSISRQKK